MSKRFDWFNAALVIALALAVIWVAIVLGRSTFGWMLSSAHAGEATITWQAPTTNCNGTSLTNLTGYTLTYGKAQEALPVTPLSKTVTGLTPGTWFFSLAAVTPTARSEFVTSQKTITPADFVTKTTTVYTFIKADGGIRVLPTLHTVPLGVVCDATQSVNGKYIIPREAVTWSGTARPVAVVGDCG